MIKMTIFKNKAMNRLKIINKNKIMNKSMKIRAIFNR